MNKAYITLLVICISINVLAQHSKKSKISNDALQNLQGTLNYEWNYAQNKDVVRSVLFQQMRFNGVNTISGAFEVIQTTSINNKSLITVLKSLKSAATQYRVTLDELLISWGMKAGYAKEVAYFANILSNDKSEKLELVKLQDEQAKRIINGDIAVTTASINEDLTFKNLEDVSFKMNNLDILLRALIKLNTLQPLTFTFGVDGLLTSIDDAEGNTLLDTKNNKDLSRCVALDRHVQLLYKKQWHNVRFQTDWFKVSNDSTQYMDTYVFKLGKNDIEPYHGDLKRLPQVNAYNVKRSFDIDSIKNDLFKVYEASNYAQLKQRIKAKYKMGVVEVMARGLANAALTSLTRTDNMVAIYKRHTVKYQLLIFDKTKNAERTLTELTSLYSDQPLYKHFD